MASTISFSGLASGIDTSSWIDALVSVRQTTITTLQEQESIKKNLLSVVSDIKSFFTSFQTCLQKITDSKFNVASMDLFAQNLAVSSNTNIATATATTDAARQSYNVLVDQLASTTKARSGKTVDVTATAALDTTLGSLGASNGTITVNNQSFSVTTSDTLKTLIQKFANVGITAGYNESKGTFNVSCSISEIDDGTTGLKTALKLQDKNVTGASSGTLVYANQNTQFSKLNLTGGGIKINDENYTITKVSDTYTIKKDTDTTSTNINTIGDFLSYLKNTVGAESATIDDNGNVLIRGAVLESVNNGSNLLNVLNLTDLKDRTVMDSNQLTVNVDHVADENTKLSDLGIINAQTLSVNGTAKPNIATDTTLGQIEQLLKSNGVDMTIDDKGVISVNTNGNEISGSILSALGLQSTQKGTTIQSSAHKVTLQATGDTKLSDLGITNAMTYTAYDSSGNAKTTAISNISNLTVNDFVNSLIDKGFDASFDSTTGKITINDGYITGTVADTLGMTKKTTYSTSLADGNTTLAQLGATGNQTMSINGATAVTYDKSTTLNTIIQAIKDAGGTASIKDGKFTVSNANLTGTVPTLLGLQADDEGSTVTSGDLSVITKANATSSSSITSTTETPISLSSKLGDILNSTANQTLSINGTTKTYTKDSTLANIQSDIQAAGGTMTLNSDNTLSITGVNLPSGSLISGLGLTSNSKATSITSNSAITVGGVDQLATRDTTLADLGAIDNTSSLSINGGTATTYTKTTTIGTILDAITAAGGTANIQDGIVTASGVNLSGSVVDLLKLVANHSGTTVTSGTLNVVTSQSATSSSALSSQQNGAITWDSTLEQITGKTGQTYTAYAENFTTGQVIPNITFSSTTTLATIRNRFASYGIEMTINDDSSISLSNITDLSGTLKTALGLNPDTYHTDISSVNPIMVSAGAHIADANTKFTDLGIADDDTRNYAIYKTDGTLIQASSNTGSAGDATIGNWLTTLNTALNTANGTTNVNYAQINNGVISVTGGYVTGALPDALGMHTSTVDSGKIMTGNNITYTEPNLSEFIGNVVQHAGTTLGDTTITSSGYIGNVVNHTGTTQGGVTVTPSGFIGAIDGQSTGSGTSINGFIDPVTQYGSANTYSYTGSEINVGGTTYSYTGTTATYELPGGVAAINTTVSNLYHGQTYVGENAGKLTITADSTINDIVNGLQAKGIEATYDELSGLRVKAQATNIMATGLTPVYEYRLPDKAGSLFSILEPTSTASDSDPYYTFAPFSTADINIADSSTPASFVSGLGSFNVTNNGTTSTISIDTRNTVSDVVSQLQNLGLTASFENGILSVSSTNSDFSIEDTTFSKKLFGGSLPTLNTTTSGSGVLEPSTTLSTIFGTTTTQTLNIQKNGTTYTIYCGDNAGTDHPTLGSNEATATTMNNLMIAIEDLTGASTNISQDKFTISDTTPLTITGTSEIPKLFGGTIPTATIGTISATLTSNSFISSIDTQSAPTGVFPSGNFLLDVDTSTDTSSLAHVAGLNSFDSGTSFQISNAADLKRLSSLVNSGMDAAGKTFYITDNIDMTGETFSSIGYTYIDNFKGSIEGCGHTISNLNSSNGLVGYYGGTSGNIDDIYLKNTLITSTSGDYKAGLVGEVLEGTSLDISNCTVTGSCNNSTDAAGLVGAVYGNADHNVTIQGCYTDVSNTSAGIICLSQKTDITSCYTTNNNIYVSTLDSNYVTGNHTNTSLVGGVSTIDTFTSGDTYYIGNADDLVHLASLVNSGQSTAGVNFVVTNDIDMSSVSNFAGIGVFSSSYAFEGNFYGNGHTISNVTMSKISNGTEDCIGFFNLVRGNNNTIEDIKLENVNIQGDSTNTVAGGLIGCAAGIYTNWKPITINNCNVSGNVSGYGAAGLIYDLSSCATIKNCYSTATVSGNGADAGGLIGDVGATTQSSGGVNYTPFINISKSFSSGTVTNTTADAGGFIGSIYSDENTISSTKGAVITDCYSISNASGGTNVGAFIGTSSKGSLARCYAYGTATNGTSSNGAFVGSNTSTNYTDCIYNSTNSQTAITGITGLSSSDMQSALTMQSHNFTTTNGWKYTSALPTLGVESIDLPSTETVSSVSDFVSGSTYHIKTVADLNQLATLVNSGKDTTNVNFVLDNDITNASALTAIGTSTNTFKGNFYGNGHTISNSGGTVNITGTDNIGLFGNISNANIKDLGIINANVTTSGNYDIGILAGYASGNSTISNCFTTGTVQGASNAGGLVGRIIGDNINLSKISSSYSTANVSTSSYSVGGLVGMLGRSTIEKSFATGTVSGTQYVGGLVGNAPDGNIKNSYATGNVTGTSSYVGGFVGNIYTSGTSASITNSYSIGTVSSQSSTSVGGFAGKIDNTTVSGNVCYSNSYSTSVGTGSTTGISTKTLSDMKTQSVMEGLGFTSANGWSYVSGLTPTFGNVTSDSGSTSIIKDSGFGLTTTSTTPTIPSVYKYVGNNVSASLTSTSYPSGNLAISSIYGANISGQVLEYSKMNTGSGEYGILESYTLTNSTTFADLQSFISSAIARHGTDGSSGPTITYNSNTGYVTTTSASRYYLSGTFLTAYNLGADSSRLLGKATQTTYNAPLAEGMSMQQIFNDTNDHTFTITKADGTSETITLSGSSTVTDLKNALSAKGISTTATYPDSTHSNYTFTSNFAWSGSGDLYQKITGTSSAITPTVTGIDHGTRVKDVSSFTTGDIYHISSIEDLNQLASLTNSGKDTTGAYFILDNDIDMSSVSNFAGIGNSSYFFKGKFYGNGHTISNVKISNSSSADVGFFGSTSGATVQDLILKDVNITGGYEVGALSGFSASSTFNNIAISGSVTASSGSYGSLAGGVIGKSYSDILSHISATDTVSATGSEVGGFIGSIYGGKINISNSYSSGAISVSTGTNVYKVGGFIGEVGDSPSDTNTINNSYTTSNITINSGGTVSAIGGLIGGFLYCGSIGTLNLDTVYSSGTMSLTGTSITKVGNLLGDDYCSNYTSQLAPFNTTNVVYNQNSYSGSTAAVGAGTQGTATGLTLAQMQTQATMESNGFTTAKGWIYNSGSTPTFSSYKLATGPVSVSDISDFVSGSTYHIKTVADLNQLATLVNSGKDTTNVSFVLDNDITDATSLTSIGNSSHAFKGTFYGNGHTISNSAGTVNITGTDNVGLFGHVEGGTIKDLGILNANVSGNNSVGILAGIFAGTIENCYTTGTVSGNSDVGGLVGYLYGEISNSYSTATVTGTDSVGGLVGHIYQGSVSKSFSTGTTTGTTKTGGLVGNIEIAGNINNSYTTSTVNGTGSNQANIGGVIGYFDKLDSNGSGIITNVYSTGTVTSSGSNIGGFAGFINSGVTVTNGVVNAASNSTIVGSGSTTGISAKTLSEMKTASTMQAAGFTTANGWKYNANSLPTLGNETMGVTAGGTVYVSSISDFVSGDTYHISTVADLNQLATLVNSGKDTTGVNFVVDNNIDVGNASLTMIGSSSANTFKGNFYGNGYTISNFTISSSSGSLGFFGTTSGATIQDLGLVNATISNTSTAKAIDQTGALVGEATNNTNINNCYVQGGSVSSTGNGLGGLVGLSTSSHVSNSYSDTTIYSNNVPAVNGSEVGGLVGSLNGTGSSIDHCYSDSNIIATNDFVLAGGLVGTTYTDSATISNSYAVGSIKGNNSSDEIGGLIGLVTGYYTGATYNTGGNVTITNAYASTQINNSGNATKIGGYIGYVDGGTATISGGAVYNSEIAAKAVGSGSATGINAYTATQMKTASTMQAAGFTTANGWKYNANSMPTLGAETITQGTGSTVYVKNLDHFSYGDTYHITDTADLNQLSNLVNQGYDTSGVTFVLDNDINLGNANFTKIGDSFNHAFKGTFYGNGNALSNFTINSSSGDVGLFGYVKGATIESLGIINATINNTSTSLGVDQTGALAGIAYDNSNINNCYVQGGSVSSTGNGLGGLLGILASSHISNSYSNTTIYSNNVPVVNGSEVGGLIGSINGTDSSIDHCYSNSNIIATNDTIWAGGLIGATYVSGTLTISDSYSTGNITGHSSSDNIGGFIGYIDNYAGASAIINRTYTATTINNAGNATNIGSFVGNVIAQSTKTITNSYYNSAIATNAIGTGSLSGMTGLTLAQMETQSTMESYGFTAANGWKYATGKTPLLQSVTSSSSQNANENTTLGSLGANTTDELTINVNGTSKTFDAGDTVKTVVDWLKTQPDVTDAKIENSKLIVSSTTNPNLSVTGGLADILFNGTAGTTTLTTTTNNASDQQKWIPANVKLSNTTTIGNLLSATATRPNQLNTTGGQLIIGGDIGKVINFAADDTVQDVINTLRDYGITANVDSNGVFTASGDKSFVLAGSIGNALVGSSGTQKTQITGYKTDSLSATGSSNATNNSTLESMGVNSGKINILNSQNQIIGSIDIDNTLTVNQLSNILSNYGFTGSLNDGKYTVTSNNGNYLADGTSNLISKFKLNNWTQTTSQLTTTNTLKDIGFTNGSSLGIIKDGTSIGPITFSANNTMQDVISTLNSYGITATIKNGVFSANSESTFTLTGDLGSYLTKNASVTNSYNQESNGYQSSEPLKEKTDTGNLSANTTISDLLGKNSGGTLRIIKNESDVIEVQYGANEKVSTLLSDLKGVGINATISNGKFNASSDDEFALSGDIGNALMGSSPTITTKDDGYSSKDLSYDKTSTATNNSVLSDMGVKSGKIYILDTTGKVVNSVDIDSSNTLSQIEGELLPYGFNMSIDSSGKVTASSNDGYTLSDGTSNLVSQLKLNTWNKTSEKLSNTTTISQMGFKNGAELDLILDGTNKNILSFNADQTLQDVILTLSAYNITASVDSNGKFTAASKEHSFVLSNELGTFLTKGTTGYVNQDTGYESLNSLKVTTPDATNTSKTLTYQATMSPDSTISDLGFKNGGTLNILLDGKTPYSLSFLSSDKVSDVLYALSAYGINGSVDSNGKFSAESTTHTFTLGGNIGTYLISGGSGYKTEDTEYTSNALGYSTTEQISNSTKLSDLGVLSGSLNIVQNGVVSKKTIQVTDNTTIGQLFGGINSYGMTGSIETDSSGNKYIKISANSNTQLVDGTSNLIDQLGFVNVKQGDYSGDVTYWENNPTTSGLITNDTLLSTFDKNGEKAAGSFIFTTGSGSDSQEHIINITSTDTVGSLLDKFKNEGVTASLDNGVIKISNGVDGITFSGGTSKLADTMSLVSGIVDVYSESSSALTYKTTATASAANYADATTTLGTMNITDGNMSVYVDGAKCTVAVKSTDTFAALFKKISDSVHDKTGQTIQAGFIDKDGNITTTPTAANNTGVVGFKLADGHQLVIGATNDTTNFATIANIENNYTNTVNGNRELYKVNASSKITDAGLFRAGTITQGDFTVGNAKITIGADTTISDVINQINNSNKSYATAYWDTLTGTMVLESTITGASLINIEAGTSNITNILGLTETKNGVESLVTDTQTLGKNAIVRINGTTVTSTTNTISSDVSKIKGLTINLKNLSAGESTTISVEEDDNSIYQAVSDTIDSYNSLMTSLNEKLSSSGDLSGDSILKLMKNNLKYLMTSSLTGSHVYKNLASVGISTGAASQDLSADTTSLTVDKETFMKALSDDSDSVKELLVGTTNKPGIFLQAGDIIDNSLKSSGYLTTLSTSLNKSITNLDNKISKANTSLADYREKLEKQFHSMESTIASLQSAYSDILSGKTTKTVSNANNNLSSSILTSTTAKNNTTISASNNNVGISTPTNNTVSIDTSTTNNTVGINNTTNNTIGLNNNTNNNKNS